MKEADKPNEGASHHESGWREALERRLSRRALLAGAAATAAVSIIGLPKKGAAAETPLQILTGPLTPSAGTPYDTMQTMEGTAYIADTGGNKNFYDGALVYYLLYYRTGNTTWLNRARALAESSRDDPSNQNIDAYLAGNYSLTVPPRRDYATLGMAIYVLEHGDSAAPGLRSMAQIVNDQARAQDRNGLSDVYTPGNPNEDARETAYSMLAFLSATLLYKTGNPAWATYNHTAAATAALNAYLAGQSRDGSGGSQPNGGWQNYDTGSLVPARWFISNFMLGLVLEALIMYDRVIGDSRIVPAIKRCVDWMWSTQWVPLGGGFGATEGTSTTSVTIGTGSRSFTTQSGLTYGNGELVHAVSNANRINGMIGTVTSYSGTTLVLNVTTAEGSGAFTDWTLERVAYPGDQTGPGIGTMQYSNIVSGTQGTWSTSDYSSLMGLYLQAWGYLYAKGQGAGYKTNGDAMFAALQQSRFFEVKQFNQLFRSSPRYLGWTAGATGQLPAPSNLLVK